LALFGQNALDRKFRGNASASTVPGRLLEEPEFHDEIFQLAELGRALRGIARGRLHHAQAAATTPPPATGYSTPPAASTIVPGSAEDLRVNVGDTVSLRLQRIQHRG